MISVSLVSLQLPEAFAGYVTIGSEMVFRLMLPRILGVVDRKTKPSGRSKGSGSGKNANTSPQNSTVPVRQEYEVFAGHAIIGGTTGNPRTYQYELIHNQTSHTSCLPK